MKIKLSFKSHFSINVLDELSPTDNVYYYPDANQQGGSDGIMVEVQPDNKHSWVGVFAYERISPKAVSGVYTMPNPSEFCVISKGAGYIVSSTNPEIWQKVKSIPVLDVRTVPSVGVIIFANFTKLIAYDNNGIKWHSNRLAMDGFDIVQVTDNYIEINRWNPRKECYENCKVDLLTGNKYT